MADELLQRLLVALSARGERRIGEVINDALLHALNFTWLQDLSDADLVGAVEREVFGDDGSLHPRPLAALVPSDEVSQ